MLRVIEGPLRAAQEWRCLQDGVGDRGRRVCFLLLLRQDRRQDRGNVVAQRCRIFAATTAAVRLEDVGDGV